MCALTCVLGTTRGCIQRKYNWKMNIYSNFYSFFFNSYNNYLQCFIGEKIPKQSSLFSSPREMNGSSSLSSSSEEFATDDFDLEVRSCSITLKYSSSVLALAKRDCALDFWVRKVCWALEPVMVGCRKPLEQSQFLIRVSVSLVCSSNFDHHFTLNVLCRISWASWVLNLRFHIHTHGRKKFVQKQRNGGNLFSDSERI